MKIVRKELAPINPLIRYDDAEDVVQTWVDDAWVDSPGSDPRTIDAFEPPDVSDPRCDGAARMSAFLQDTVEAIIAGVDDDKSDAELALIVLGVLVIIPLIDILYVLIAALVGALIIAGSSFLHSAFDTFDWEELTCVIYPLCNENGFIDDEHFQDLPTNISATFDTDPASILNDILVIVGRGGLNDAAALRSETGDCEDCQACDDVLMHSAWANFLTANIPAGYTMVDQNGGADTSLYLYKDDYTKAGCTFSPRCIQQIDWAQVVSSGAKAQIELRLAGAVVDTSLVIQLSGGKTWQPAVPRYCDEIRICQRDGTANGQARFTSMDVYYFEPL